MRLAVTFLKGTGSLGLSDLHIKPGVAPSQTKTLSYWGMILSVIPEAGLTQQNKALESSLDVFFWGLASGKLHDLSMEQLKRTYWLRALSMDREDWGIQTRETYPVVCNRFSGLLISFQKQRI